jgi:hypothetical protein
MVQFVNEQGKVFFECHPAEARAAMEVIADVRANKPPVDPEIKKMARAVDGILKMKHRQVQVKSGTPMIHRVADCFAEIEKANKRVAYVVMHPMVYGDVRKWNRNEVEIETKASHVRIGIMAWLWGAPIIVHRLAPLAAVVVANEDLTESVVAEIEPRKTLEFRKEILDIINKLREIVEAGVVEDKPVKAKKGKK